MRRVDLNADVGESFGPYVIGDDAAVLRSVTSASIAAGFHAGDASVLRRTVRLAKEHGVAVGAHPGFFDLAGFGRREIRMRPEEAEDLVLYQIAAVAGVASSEGIRLQHVKPHGALYNMAVRDRGLADAIARATASLDDRLILCAPPRSALAEAGDAAGLRVAREGFADRAYHADGTLVPRHLPGAVIVSVEEVVTRAIQMAIERTVVAVDGSAIALEVDTICVHGDSVGAGALAAWLRAGLTSSGIEVRALGA
ncbi:MAG: LamB/YcsF family protein [Vicinamibacterales bacterium]